MNRSIVIATATLALCGCVHVETLPVQGNGARMEITLANDSTGSIMKAWHVSAFKDARCEKEEQGVLLARKVYASDATALDTVTLPTGNTVALSFSYSDVRLGAGVGCMYALAFVPMENQRYKAHFAVVDNAASCKAVITDSAGQPVKFTTPAQACASGVVSIARPNGQGSISVSRPVSVMSR